jgi:hypothetical protein
MKLKWEQAAKKPELTAAEISEIPEHRICRISG